MTALDVGLMVAGLVGLFWGGNWLVEGASNIARVFKISPLIVGLTIVAVGTSMPELLVSVQAAVQDLSEIALGNVVGSNIANIGLILGLSAVVMPIKVHEIMIRREIPMMIGVTILTALMMLDGEISRVDGLVLVTGFVCFTALFYWLAQQERRSAAVRLQQGDIEDEDNDSDLKTVPPQPQKLRLNHEIARFVIGLIVLVVGANWLISGATNIARALQISELVIGLTMIAIGTSLPELVTSLTAAFKKQNDIALGNVVGSNISNLLLILGVTALIAPIPVSQNFLGLELLMLIAFSIILFPFVLNRTLNRLPAVVLLGLYTGFILYNVLNARTLT
jgi:cation:H+ antiporter